MADFKFQEIGPDDIPLGAAMHLNRAARRRLQSINKTTRIPGVTSPIINPKRQEKKKNMLLSKDGEPS